MPDLLAAAQKRILELEAGLREYREAMRLTREYVGENVLPARLGWSWFDADETARALLSTGLADPEADATDQNLRDEASEAGVGFVGDAPDA